MSRLVPVVVLVPSEVAAWLDELFAARMAEVDDPDGLAKAEAVLAERGWTPEMLVVGSVLTAAWRNERGEP